MPLVGASDGHGHGTHVAGIATGPARERRSRPTTGEYAGIAPDAELAVGKVLTDAGAGMNSDLLAAMEWAAMPADPARAAVGAHVVNLSLGSESRPGRLNTGSDVDLVSQMLNRLAVRYGTLFVAAAGNSGPFVGSVLEAPGAAAQALSVAASAKDYDVNHDDTLSGRHVRRLPASALRRRTTAAPASAPSRRRSAPSRRAARPATSGCGPTSSAPGYNIVSAQAATGAALAQNDLNRGTRGDPLYATATGTSMATPATAGSAALLLQGYRARHGSLAVRLIRSRGPRGARVRARSRGADEHRRQADQYEARWILSTDLGDALSSARPSPIRSSSSSAASSSQIGNDAREPRAVRGAQRRRRPVRRAAGRRRRQAARGSRARSPA